MNSQGLCMTSGKIKIKINSIATFCLFILVFEKLLETICFVTELEKVANKEMKRRCSINFDFKFFLIS